MESEPGVWDSIVILDSSLKNPSFVSGFSKQSLILQFDDIVEPTSNKVPPSSVLIRQAIEFGLASEKLMVCCRAGQSRSAATAFAIAFEKLGEKAALELLNPKRHSPNYRIVRIAADLIERPGLLNAYDDWGYNHGDIQLTDFLDEIELEYDELESAGGRNGSNRRQLEKLAIG